MGTSMRAQIHKATTQQHSSKWQQRGPWPSNSLLVARLSLETALTRGKEVRQWGAVVHDNATR